ncbi:DUF3300 domain-containing protein [Tunturiibacter empetritectus]|uniref:Uncharacterized protein n=1 Tax=Tunturiibacter lichenicola TaxID=2051959 RepID=A0A852VEX6_9BACT|nr:DUF3300 domain-containing protein [Edaphobacter lichenicola]NYF91408.1 hypothetical protein [Edaphobacter lichenicola]
MDLSQRAEVMDAVQRMRQKARSYGDLAPNSYVNMVETGGSIEIRLLNPAVFYVPYYDPVIVFARPWPGFVVGTAIRFGPAVTISATFGTWGWCTGPAFFWPAHTIVIGGNPWEHSWVNRGSMFTPYSHPRIRPVGPRVRSTGDKKRGKR